MHNLVHRRRLPASVTVGVVMSSLAVNVRVTTSPTLAHAVETPFDAIVRCVMFGGFNDANTSRSGLLLLKASSDDEMLVVASDVRIVQP